MIEDLYQVLIAIVRKRASELTPQEMSQILEREATIKREAQQIVETEIPDLIKYLDFVYPSSELIGFKQFTGGKYG